MRIFKDWTLRLIAVLPGKTMPKTQSGISAITIRSTWETGRLRRRSPLPALTVADYEKNAEYRRPALHDWRSGVAPVMELARVMSQYEFDNTVFAAFAGEDRTGGSHWKPEVP